MITLGIETSTEMGSAALVEDDHLLGEMTFLARERHCRLILKTIDLLTDMCGVPLGKIDLFAASLGPGSFTGLRVGLATLKGIASGLGKPIQGISTLEAFASQVPYTPYPIYPMIPARKGEIYTARFKFDHKPWPEIAGPVRMIATADLLAEIGETVHLLGQVPAEWVKSRKECTILSSPLSRYPRAEAVAMRALAKYRTDERDREEDPVLILPEFPARKARAGGIVV